MAEKAKGKRIPPQPGGRMLLGLSDEIQAIPYEDKEKVLENMSTLPTLFDFFIMLPILMNHLQKKVLGAYTKNSLMVLYHPRMKDQKMILLLRISRMR